MELAKLIAFSLHWTDKDQVIDGTSLQHGVWRSLVEWTGHLAEKHDRLVFTPMLCGLGKPFQVSESHFLHVEKDMAGKGSTSKIHPHSNWVKYVVI